MNLVSKPTGSYISVFLTLFELEGVQQAANLEGRDIVDFIRVSAVRSANEKLGMVEIALLSREDLGIFESVGSRRGRKLRPRSALEFSGNDRTPVAHRALRELLRHIFRRM